MDKLRSRLTALETRHRPRHTPTRFFTGYVAEDRYYEAGITPINYRSGINNAPEDGECFSRADLAEMERQGYQLSVISVVYAAMDLEKKHGG